ncbi:MAG: biopolymer transporter ExbD [Cytophagales bacterium]|nr:biopolymer transporter ExbD [Cytophagales bacterium]
MAEINMVPFIDVMLVLLIIFMVTAPLITPSMIDLPSMGKAAQQPDKVVQVVIGIDGTLKLKTSDAPDERAISNIDQLANAVHALIGTETSASAQSKPAVVISADKNVKYETVLQVMDTLQRAGVPRLGLSVKPAP